MMGRTCKDLSMTGPDPEQPGCVTHLDATEKNPVKSNGDGYLHHDGQTSAKVDFLFAVKLHHSWFMRLHAQIVLLFSLARCNNLHFCHGAVAGRRKRKKWPYYHRQ